MTSLIIQGVAGAGASLRRSIHRTIDTSCSLDGGRSLQCAVSTLQSFTVCKLLHPGTCSSSEMHQHRPQGAVCTALPTGKWMGDVTQVANLRHLLSVEPRRPQVTIRSRQSDYSTSTPVQRGTVLQGRRAFADYTFYKGKGAMCMKPGRPTFRSLDNGGYALEKEGTLYLEFTPALGPRQYDWGRKQIISLSVLELGTLVGLTMGETCEFFHDPYMGKSDAGKVRKVLKVDPMTDQTGFFFNFSMANKMENIDLKVSIALSRAEYSVIRSSVNYIIPYLMGWHMIVDPSKLEDYTPAGESAGLSAKEWDK